MERAERFVFLSIGLAFGILVPVLWVMLVLTAFTAADRFRRVYRQADRPQRSHTTIRRTGTRTSDRRVHRDPCGSGGRPAASTADAVAIAPPVAAGARSSPVRGRSDHRTRLSRRERDRADAARVRPANALTRVGGQLARRFMHGRREMVGAAPAACRPDATPKPRSPASSTRTRSTGTSCCGSRSTSAAVWSHSTSGSTATSTSWPGSRRGTASSWRLPHLGGWEYGAAGMA